MLLSLVCLRPRSHTLQSVSWTDTDCESFRLIFFWRRCTSHHPRGVLNGFKKYDKLIFDWTRFHNSFSTVSKKYGKLIFDWTRFHNSFLPRGVHKLFWNWVRAVNGEEISAVRCAFFFWKCSAVVLTCLQCNGMHLIIFFCTTCFINYFVLLLLFFVVVVVNVNPFPQH